MMSDNLVTTTFEINQEVYDQASEVCKQLGTTVEIMAESFIKFCMIPEDLSITSSYTLSHATLSWTLPAVTSTPNTNRHILLRKCQPIIREA